MFYTDCKSGKRYDVFVFVYGYIKENREMFGDMESFCTIEK